MYTQLRQYQKIRWRHPSIFIIHKKMIYDLQTNDSTRKFAKTWNNSDQQHAESGKMNLHVHTDRRVLLNSFVISWMLFVNCWQSNHIWSLSNYIWSIHPLLLDCICYGVFLKLPQVLVIFQNALCQLLTEQYLWSLFSCMVSLSPSLLYVSFGQLCVWFISFVSSFTFVWGPCGNNKNLRPDGDAKVVICCHMWRIRLH